MKKTLIALTATAFFAAPAMMAGTSHAEGGYGLQYQPLPAEQAQRGIEPGQPYRLHEQRQAGQLQPGQTHVGDRPQLHDGPAFGAADPRGLQPLPEPGRVALHDGTIIEIEGRNAYVVREFERTIIPNGRHVTLDGQSFTTQNGVILN